MISVEGKNIGIIGGGGFCKNFLQILAYDGLFDPIPRVLGVADRNKEAEGILYAKEQGLFTTHDHRELFRFKDLQVILELTRDNFFSEMLKKEIPPGVQLIDHFEAAFIWNSLRMEQERLKALKELSKYEGSPEKTRQLFKQYSDHLIEIINKRTEYSLKIERDLVEKESAMSQIIQGSVIPTFVINKDHKVIHWNKALEKLSGFSSEEMVGTTRQSVPFWRKERPTMADVVLDQTTEADIEKLYRGASHKSTLIEGALEAEAFFPSLGKSGKWCWFTAAPIHAPDGTIIGAIETLWDTTEKKIAEEEREEHTKELSALCSIYGALNTPSNFDERIREAVQEVKNFLSADAICIYLLKGDGQFHMRYSEGLSEEACLKSSIADENSTIYRVAQSNEYKILEDLPHGCEDEICFLEETKLVSLAYIPISSNDRRITGVIRIGSTRPGHFTQKQKNILELVGNRIGVAIENMRLQQQSAKSEEKYRTLFDNDPHPTFILDQQDFLVLDTNERAQECYGYSREELLGIPFIKLGDENDEELLEGLANLTEGRSSRFIKKRHYRKGGQPFFINVNFSLAKYGKRNFVIASTTDITESVEKEAQLIQAGKMTTLGVMAAGMAHEINQPLNVIQVCADYFQKMLKRGQPIEDKDLKSMANDIISNVARATAVIKHVRDFARQSDVVKDKVNINDPIKDVFKVLGHQLKVHEIELELDLDPDIPLIMAEYNRLEQVFINLVTNSIDAMDELDQLPEADGGEKRLTIKSFADHDQVVVTVSDTGTGMSEEVKKKIFEPFFTTKKIGKGTGLGISISYGIIKDYDGTIAVESEVGKGTTFYLRFPGLNIDHK